MNQVLISVIIPNYNYSCYLRQCLQSVLDSEVGAKEMEIIVVDDASTDDSVKVVEEMMKGSRFPIRLLKNETNLGLILSRNRGIANASGDFLFFLDSDNYIRKDCIKTHLNAIIQNPDAIACYAPLQDFTNGTGEYLGLRSDKPFDYSQLLKGTYIDAMAMFRKKDLLEIGLYDNKMPAFGWEDYELWLRVGKLNKKVTFIDGEPLSFYRTHPLNMSRNYNPDQYNHLVYYLKQKYPITLPIILSTTLDSLIYPINLACHTEINCLQKQVADLKLELITIKGSFSYRMAKLLLSVHKVLFIKWFKEKVRLRKEIRLIQQSGLFDIEYYLLHNPDVSRSKMNPAKHFLLYGGFEGRNPSIKFDTTFYLAKNPDTKENGMNPLVHYLLFRRVKGREPLSIGQLQN